MHLYLNVCAFVDVPTHVCVRAPPSLPSMEAQIDRYITDPSLTWDDVFRHERLPWARHQSLDNVYSGLLVKLFKEHGGVAFLARWFEAIPMLLTRTPASKYDYQGARDNFYLAACHAAGHDLRHFFVDVLRWEVSEGLG